MAEKVQVQPHVLRWARERASLDQDALAHKMGLKVERITEWETTGQIEMAHLERLAAKTYTPFGFLFLPTPPQEQLPISDFRTVGGAAVGHPSPELLDTIYKCQIRQSFFREFLIEEGERPLPFVGSATLAASPQAVASEIRATLDLPSARSAQWSNWETAFGNLVERVENARVLVMRSGVVGNNTHRRLNSNEFRGFALSDPLAPLIFVNIADTMAARIFTLAHELGHVWLGQSGVSDVSVRASQASERFCNAVAAEVLVPLSEFRTAWDDNPDRKGVIQRLVRQFKVSSLTVLIRAKEAGFLPDAEFDALYAAELSRLQDAERGGGGNFYRNQDGKLGKRFARSVIVSALEGRTPYREAYRLLDVKGDSFTRMARELEVLQG